MKKVLLTGATGFIGRNILPLLREKYDVTAPSRAQLDLLDGAAVRRFLSENRFNAVVHLGNPTAQNPIDTKEALFERSLRVFTSLEDCAALYGKMIYLGSGAEYGKHRALVQIEEDAFGRELPREAYGLSRFVMNRLSQTRDNIVNLRLFGCYGPGDPPYKLMPHIAGCIRRNTAITLHQDVWFDFLYVEDICPVLVYFIENDGDYKAYNLCGGERVRISAIAEELRLQMGAKLPVVFERDGLGLEYTGSNLRLRAALPAWRPLTIRDGIRRLLHYENW